MRIVALIVASAAALTLAACGNNAEETAPEASTEAAEASGIADQAAVTVTEDQAAADAKAAADAAAASEVAQTAPAAAPAVTEPAPTMPAEGH
ncbi:MAG: hypothetical protein KKG14_07355 [Alphaproteobacteria bacterium]|nr:hypothetical protein [Alphaproteobacteria bacterium]MBU2271494.1 hypothetical protein [Alphaproteobacteria bacterium]MBU2418503.1 hypothetical protein [Alphaproteobacteria bacterium]